MADQMQNQQQKPEPVFFQQNSHDLIRYDVEIIGGSDEQMKEDTREKLPYKVFRERLREHFHDFDGNYLGCGRNKGTYIVRVKEGYRQNARTIVQGKVTTYLDNVEFEELKDFPGRCEFLGPCQVECGCNLRNMDLRRYKDGKNGPWLNGRLNIALENKADPTKKYLVSAGHTVIEKCDITRVATGADTFDFDLYDRVMQCEVQHDLGKMETREIEKVLAEKVHAGVEMHDNYFMDCCVFQLQQDLSTDYDFKIPRVTLPVIYTDEELSCDEIYRTGQPQVPGKVINDDADWVVEAGNDVAIFFSVFYVKGTQGKEFASSGDSGQLLYDRQGYLYGMVIGRDKEMQVTVCIRLDRMVKYCEEKLKVKLQLATDLRQQRGKPRANDAEEMKELQATIQSLEYKLSQKPTDEQRVEIGREIEKAQNRLVQLLQEHKESKKG